MIGRWLAPPARGADEDVSLYAAEDKLGRLD